MQADYRFTDRFRGHAGAAMTTIPQNIWQDNFLTGSLPFVFYPRVTAAAGAQHPYGYQIDPAQIPRAYTPEGTDIFASGRFNAVPANTVLDLDRFERDLAKVSGQSGPLNAKPLPHAPGARPFDLRHHPLIYAEPHPAAPVWASWLPPCHPSRRQSEARRGWQVISVSSISSGPPSRSTPAFNKPARAPPSRQTRPDRRACAVGRETRREDYIVRGDSNASFFSIPVNVAGGTGPNQGRFGDIGRNSFRGGAFYNFDLSLVKDTPVGRRKSASELVNVQFRSEFFTSSTS